MGGHRTKQDMRPVWRKPWEFLTVFLLVFFLFSVALFAIDFVPEAPKYTGADVTFSASSVTSTPTAFAAEPVTAKPAITVAAKQTSASSEDNVLPVRVKVASVGIDTAVVNPSSTDIKVLDDALMRGAARYPESATLEEVGGILIFGHQSRLPVVKNKAFKAFANLQNVKQGEEIIVYSAAHAYSYRVVSVEHKSALDGFISFPPNQRSLVLSTCDSFGEKTDRYVVTAEFVSVRSIQ